MQKNKKKPISNKIIKQLITQGCSSNNWNDVYIDDSDISEIKDTIFHGEINIKGLNGLVEYHKGVKVKAAIVRATLINTNITGSVYINNIERFISSYTIEHGVIIENVGAIYIDNSTSFGNGISISPMIETGGREVKIYNRLNSHTAYIIALYRHKKHLIEKLDSLIDKYVKEKESTIGKIKNNAKIINARLIRNTLIDPYSTIENTDEITNSTIVSTEECPSYIGTSVIIKDSIILKGAHITDSVIVIKSFIGEGTRLGRQFSCESSLLFANCEGEHGEMFSIFAGPYTVTHHKSTLLIASHFSFFNAGSGTNQSNHMYKLGPCHQGFTERGCKTGSNSYILWPSYIAAFTTVLGSHYNNVDASEFPFSYLTEYDFHKTRLIPALNLFGVGLCRDEIKWHTRDRRLGNKKDYVIFDVFNPYTVSKMIYAEKKLAEITDNISKSDEYENFIEYKNMIIKKSSLEKYASRYGLAIDLYLHNILLKKIEEYDKFDTIKAFLSQSPTNIYEKWLDIAGLIAPKKRVEMLISKIENDKIGDIRDISFEWESIYNNYKSDEWNYVYNEFSERYNIKLENINESELKKILLSHKSYIEKSLKIFEHDIKKEFDKAKQVSFGIDDIENRAADFEIIRGNTENNTFALQYRSDTTDKKNTIDKILSFI